MRGKLEHSVAFAEYAEAVGVPTSQVIALMETPTGHAFVIIYTPEPIPEDDPDGVDTTAWTAGLARDADKIVRVIVEPSPCPFSVEVVIRTLATTTQLSELS